MVAPAAGAGLPEYYNLVQRRTIYLKRYLSAIRQNTLPPVWNMDDVEAVAAMLEGNVAPGYVRSVDSLTEELDALTHLKADLDRYQASLRTLNHSCRSLALMAQTPDVRPTSHTYVQKQDVEYCVVRVENIPRLCCKTVAVELANAFIGGSVEENTVENYSLWYFRTCRFNMTAEMRMKCAEGTIKYAESLIHQRRRELGLPYNEKYAVARRSVAVGQQVLSTIRNAWSSTEGLPMPARFVASATFLAGMPYGVFGVRAMRPLKQDF